MDIWGNHPFDCDPEHIFDWSSYISTAENLEFMKRIVQNNLPLAILLYMVLTVVGCVVLALPGVTFAILAGLLFGPVIGTEFVVLWQQRSGRFLHLLQDVFS